MTADTVDDRLEDSVPELVAACDTALDSVAIEATAVVDRDTEGGGVSRAVRLPEAVIDTEVESDAEIDALDDADGLRLVNEDVCALEESRGDIVIERDCAGVLDTDTECRPDADIDEDADTERLRGVALGTGESDELGETRAEDEALCSVVAEDGGECDEYSVGEAEGERDEAEEALALLDLTLELEGSGDKDSDAVALEVAETRADNDELAEMHSVVVCVTLIELVAV